MELRRERAEKTEGLQGTHHPCFSWGKGSPTAVGLGDRLGTRIDELGAPQGNGFRSSLVSLMVVNPQKNSIGLALSKPKQANLPQTPQNTSKQHGASAQTPPCEPPNEPRKPRDSHGYCIFTTPK